MWERGSHRFSVIRHPLGWVPFTVCRFPFAVFRRRRNSIGPPPPRFFCKCGKQRTLSPLFLYVWQGKDLRAHFPYVWQGKDLAEKEAGPRIDWDGPLGTGAGRLAVNTGYSTA